MTKVYMKADVASVKDAQLARVLAKAFEHKSVKLVRVEYTACEYIDLTVFKGNVWQAKRIAFCECIDLPGARDCKSK